jgi:hypothetical protein
MRKSRFNKAQIIAVLCEQEAASRMLRFESQGFEKE